MPVGLILLILFVIGIIVFIGIVLLEAAVLGCIKWGSSSLRDSFSINLPTTILGVLMAGPITSLILGSSLGAAFLNLVLLLYRVVSWPIVTLLRIITGNQVFFFSEFLTVIIIVIMWAVSVAIEGALLQLIRRQPARKTLRAVIIANAISYTVLGILTPLFAWI